MKTNSRHLVWLLAIGLCGKVDVRATSVVNSVHNLSASGPGTIKAASEQNVCVFCHTVHNASGQTPLWNHNLSGITNYVVYSSPTLKAVVGQPNGSSRLCLSCHDGTVALGSVNDRTSIAFQNGVTTMPAGPSNLGTDLSGDHPISFVYDAALAAQDTTLNPPSSLTGKVKLDHSGQMQCTACHDPHDNQFGNFLVMDNTGSALCLVCHNSLTWPTSPHSLSAKIVAPPLLQKPSPKPKAAPAAARTVAGEGCANCHLPHRAGSKRHLLRFESPEQNCLVCHNGSVTAKNVAADFQKASVHPIAINGRAHEPEEDPVNPPTRHVTCTDCHNPHGSTMTPGAAAKSSAELVGVVGLSANGAVVKSASREYELCFRCHADSFARGPARVNRQVVETNTRLQFNPNNQSFHPLETIGRNRFVPSLIAPWNTSSTLTCTDCHNSDQSPAAGGTGANGPHGSIYSPLLERQLVLTDYTPESPENYALCYKCHSRDSILSDQSFRAVDINGQSRGHRFHIVDQKTACSTCHDSHGVVANSSLINFNLDYVSPSSGGTLSFTSGGATGGTCTLTCHGHEHTDASYSAFGVKTKILRSKKR